MSTDTLSGSARWARRLGVTAGLLGLGGPLLAHLEVVPPMLGFTPFMLAALLAILAVLVGVVALLLGPAPSRRAALTGLVPAVLLLGITGAVVARSGGGGGPRINDITTDTVNPPQFAHAPTLPGNRGRDMRYPGEAFATQQRDAYPDVQPLRVLMPPDEAYAAALAAARDMPGWELTRTDADARVIEAVDTTWLFRFKDDIVIEIRPEDNHSVIQMRSKSRDGQGDVGANAARIRAFFKRVS